MTTGAPIAEGRGRLIAGQQDRLLFQYAARGGRRATNCSSGSNGSTGMVTGLRSSGA
jgi:hypothetical protein